jgi:hypothetical protein
MGQERRRRTKRNKKDEQLRSRTVGMLAREAFGADQICVADARRRLHYDRRCWKLDWRMTCRSLAGEDGDPFLKRENAREKTATEKKGVAVELL